MRSLLSPLLFGIVASLWSGCAQAQHPLDGAESSMTTNSTTESRYEKPGEAELRKKLSPLQFKVTQESATESPFHNEFWNNKEEGLYVDVVSGEPLFSSRNKFDSRTGWPSFTQPIEPARVVDVADSSHGMTRTEVRSKDGDSHLGHVFEDGPRPSGRRYCINSAALRFIPVSQLEAEGYGEYLAHFGEKAVAPDSIDELPPSSCKTPAGLPGKMP